MTLIVTLTIGMPRYFICHSVYYCIKKDDSIVSLLCYRVYKGKRINAMAKIYKMNGEVLDIEPKNGQDFQLEELQTIVGGLIQIIEINDTEIMVINEEGKLENLPLNEQATAIYQKQVCEGDFIVGDVLICKNEEVR